MVGDVAVVATVVVVVVATVVVEVVAIVVVVVDALVLEVVESACAVDAVSPPPAVVDVVSLSLGVAETSGVVVVVVVGIG